MEDVLINSHFGVDFCFSETFVVHASGISRYEKCTFLVSSPNIRKVFSVKQGGKLVLKNCVFRGAWSDVEVRGGSLEAEDTEFNSLMGVICLANSTVSLCRCKVFSLICGLSATHATVSIKDVFFQSNTIGASLYQSVATFEQCSFKATMKCAVQSIESALEVRHCMFQNTSECGVCMKKSRASIVECEFKETSGWAVVLGKKCNGKIERNFFNHSEFGIACAQRSLDQKLEIIANKFLETKTGNNFDDALFIYHDLDIECVWSNVRTVKNEVLK